MEGVSVIQTFTFALAVLGAVLGVINTLHSLDRTRIKLRVRPARAIPVGPGASRSLNFCIEVTNLSAFAVTVRDVGVFHHGTDQRSSFAIPILLDGGSWPRRLEPRSSVTIYGEFPESPNHQRISSAYAITACGVTKTGNSPALKQVAREQRRQL